jgi:hypothetical protein
MNKRTDKPAHCFDCKWLHKMKSGKDWCLNDKSWLVGWIPEPKEQGCEHYQKKTQSNEQEK